MNLHLGRLQNQYRKVNNLFMFVRIFAQDLPIQVQDYSKASLPRVIRTMQIAFNDCIEAKLPYMHIPTLVMLDEKDLIFLQKFLKCGHKKLLSFYPMEN